MAEPLKNGLARSALVRLAKNLKTAAPRFEERRFVHACLQDLEPLELKERVAHVAAQLPDFLPASYPAALKIILRSIPTWDGGDEEDPLRGFAAWPLFQFVEDQGRKDFTASMDALAELTHLFTAEFAVRAFIAEDRERAMKIIAGWAVHPSDQVRRLASEACRPHLPWARKLPALVEYPEDGLGILEELKDDPSEYVRRSVGNHLNDVAKDHADLVIDLCEKWKAKASAERAWIIDRATRTLVKDGHPRVWTLLGFTQKPKIQCSPLSLASPHLKLGGELSFNFSIKSLAGRKQKLAVDYAVHFKKANGSSRPKVFKLKVVSLAPGKELQLNKRQTIKAISTRKYYPGTHELEILINGQTAARATFELRLP